MDENIDAPEVIETQELAEETIETPEETPEDTIARLEQEKQELDDKNKKLYARLKKEDKPKEDVSTVQTNDALSPKDFLAMTERQVSSDDFDEVVRVSKLLNKPVHEALKDKTLQTILETRVEERKTAAATQSRGGQRAVSRVSGEELLNRAQKTGEVPATDEGMTALAEARLFGKK